MPSAARLNHLLTDDDGLDPEIRAFRQQLRAGYAMHPELDGLPKAEARRVAEAVRAPLVEGGPVMARTIDSSLAVGGRAVRLRTYRPETRGSDADLPALVYLHGGGWTLFSIDTHDRLMREYAARAGVAVVGVDYALAPEAPYPQALTEVVAVFEWLRANGHDLGIDPRRLALGGDSAGGNLALAAAVRLRDTTGLAGLCALVLNYGAFSRRVDSQSHRRYSGPAYLLTSDEMVGFWTNYLGVDEPGDTMAEPLRADLHGLPPTLLVVAECDVLHDDSLAMAARLAEAGVVARSVVYPGTTHGFLEAMAIAAVSRRALDESAAWLRGRMLRPFGEEDT